MSDLANILSMDHARLALEYQRMRTLARDLAAALDESFFALGRAGGNVAGSEYRRAWEAARDALARALETGVIQ